MEARFNYMGSSIAAKFAKHINAAGLLLTESTLPRTTQELVKIRASQINGCAVFTDMHTMMSLPLGRALALRKVTDDYQEVGLASW